MTSREEAFPGPTDRDNPANDSLRRPRRWPYVLGVLVFLLYAGWMIGPYARSTVVRDAAVTAWSNTASAPIAGTVSLRTIEFSKPVDGDGAVAQIINPRLSRRALDQAELRVASAEAQIAELQAHLDEIKQLDAERGDLKGIYAATFRDQIDTAIGHLDTEIGLGEERLELLETIASRQEELASRGTVAINQLDEVRLRVSDLRVELARLRSKLDYARVRRKAADSGIFITADGDDPPWVRGSRIELKMAKKTARLELRRAEVELAEAEGALAAAREEHARQSRSVVKVPTGAMVWRERVAPGMTVHAGEALLEWIDCGELMVDVPVSDAAVSLIRKGMTAQVVIEGESFEREARVLLARGSASTLGTDDLAAVAKGRGPGTAQVLLTLDGDGPRFPSCPVGRAAYVDFPGVGLIDVLRARLRL